MRAGIALALAASALTGCNLLFGLEEGTLDPNFGGGGAATASSSSTGMGGADWSCVGDVKEKKGDQAFLYKLTESKADSLIAETPTSVLCQADTPTCSPSSPVVVSSNGSIPVSAPEAFLGGYFVLTSNKYRPYVVELAPAVDLPDPLRLVPMYTGPEVAAAFFLLGVGVDEQPNHGIVGVFARDCQGLPAAGVGLESLDQDTTTRLLYLDKNGNFQKTFQETDEAGTALFMNLPIGDAVRIVLRRSSDAVIVAQTVVHVRDKTITAIHLRPTP